jgi:hypothetical protein
VECRPTENVSARTHRYAVTIETKSSSAALDARLEVVEGVAGFGAAAVERLVG